MVETLAKLLVEKKEQRGLEVAKKIYKKLRKHRKYSAFMDDVNLELELTGNEDIIVND